MVWKDRGYPLDSHKVAIQEHKMNPRPDFGEESYKGHGKLEGKARICFAPCCRDWTLLDYLCTIVDTTIPELPPPHIISYKHAAMIGFSSQSPMGAQAKDL